ncbi:MULTISPECIES: GyrI-like domain-containing protein [Variovorax]|jgi:predicted transcriptional regulator YdeE|uniref:GyrI-like domain-containing protein n=1 Tax=Variovorax TaxID=34072 RepID=UPI00086D1183|nr:MULTISPECIES: GyrI-like domain-containing protein [Variovorax]MBN8753441.1 effector binding domain-containing protein [Variovorax sp.]ODU15725.1 MAG: transcriptional regulator [Variovorax sp. SCN 67-85]ODV27601.1 MAG: transcriptional regulator [Variovorax sp. SCN 67-20]OJZ11485.1 MAG: AraC family transcriptional regulator [Variovorax sp. 67-131]UKI05868.1 GyrI-like domain-containing protein [Variovorax paradoxus]
MEPIRQHVDAFRVSGLTVRTTNREESDPATARLGALWGRFFGEETYASTPNRTADTRIFGVYSAYESDANGAFDVTAGVVVTDGEGSIPIEAGNYLVFNGQGEMPQMVISTWQRIWQYFEAHPNVARSYRSDFEAYEGPDKVAIHIGVA